MLPKLTFKFARIKKNVRFFLSVIDFVFFQISNRFNTLSKIT